MRLILEDLSAKNFHLESRDQNMILKDTSLPSAGAKPICLSSATLSQEDAEGSKVYLPMGGLSASAKEAMLVKKERFQIDLCVYLFIQLLNE